VGSHRRRLEPEQPTSAPSRLGAGVPAPTASSSSPVTGRIPTGGPAGARTATRSFAVGPAASRSGLAGYPDRWTVTEIDTVSGPLSGGPSARRAQEDAARAEARRRADAARRIAAGRLTAQRLASERLASERLASERLASERRAIEQLASSSLSTGLPAASPHAHGAPAAGGSPRAAFEPLQPGTRPRGIIRYDPDRYSTGGTTETGGWDNHGTAPRPRRAPGTGAHRAARRGADARAGGHRGMSRSRMVVVGTASVAGISALLAGVALTSNEASRSLAGFRNSNNSSDFGGGSPIGAGQSGNPATPLATPSSAPAGSPSASSTGTMTTGTGGDGLPIPVLTIAPVPAGGPTSTVQDPYAGTPTSAGDGMVIYGEVPYFPLTPASPSGTGGQTPASATSTPTGATTSGPTSTPTATSTPTSTPASTSRPTSPSTTSPSTTSQSTSTGQNPSGPAGSTSSPGTPDGTTAGGTTAGGTTSGGTASADGSAGAGAAGGDSITVETIPAFPSGGPGHHPAWPHSG